MKISACLITLNEELNLPRCLASIKGLMDEIVVVDSGSNDRTVEIAQTAGARVLVQKWLGYVGQKNFALDQASHPWVLSIDADEEVSPELAASIQKVRQEGGGKAGYEISRLVFYRGRWIYHGDWYPDKLVRLFLKEKARFQGAQVHERLEVSGTCGMLPGHLYHYTYRDQQDRARRIEHYARLWAQSALAQGKRAALWTGPVHAAVRLVRGLIVKGGLLDGVVGWDIALGNAREVWLKYEILRELARPPAR
jgi:glycosyltransferase involved in cell wall biosynthesis